MTEIPIYGSSRLGVIKENKLLKVKTAQNNIGVMSLPIPVNIAQSKNTPKPVVYTMGKKHYESVDWLGNVRVTYTDKKSWQQNKFSLNVSSSLDYYPFGSVMEGRNLEITNYRFGYGGHEKIDEVSDSGNTIDMGDRWLDTRIGRTYKQDRNGGSYPFISPYSYVLNNSINVIDPDGKDVYLIVWATSDGKIGHAGIAVDNYKKVETRVLENGKEVTKIEYVKDGTVTYYDLWPGEPVGAGNAGKDVPAVYNIKVTTLDEIKNTDITESEGYAPDGVLKLSTDYATDQKTKEAIEQFMKDNPNYNGRTCNCSDLAEVGVEAVADKNIKANEFIPFKLSTTPNKLFRKTSKLPNAEVVKDPGDKVNKSFLKGVLEKPESERNK